MIPIAFYASNTSNAPNTSIILVQNLPIRKPQLKNRQ